MEKKAAKKAGRRQPAKRAVAAKKAAVAAKLRRSKTAARQVAAPAINPHALAHGLNGLLHTMQAVQQHEETLCSLMHALKRGRATKALVAELREVLQQLPAHDYLHEVEALQAGVA